jgi:hypothetical protein
VEREIRADLECDLGFSPDFTDTSKKVNTVRDGAGHTDSAGDVLFEEVSEFDFDQSQSFDDCESSA